MVRAEGSPTITCVDPEVLQEPGRLLMATLRPIVEGLTGYDNYEPGAIVPTDIRECDDTIWQDYVVRQEDACPNTVHLLPPARLVAGLGRLGGLKARRSVSVTSQPNMLTTTISDREDSDQLIGVHIDRGPDQVRLAINMGPAIRFLIIALTSPRFIPGSADSGRVPRTDDLRRYVAMRPIQGLLAGIRPQEAYIAKTGEIGHDGSTIGSILPSTVRFDIDIDEEAVRLLLEPLPGLKTHRLP